MGVLAAMVGFTIGVGLAFTLCPPWGSGDCSTSSEILFPALSAAALPLLIAMATALDSRRLARVIMSLHCNQRQVATRHNLLGPRRGGFQRRGIELPLASASGLAHSGGGTLAILE